MGHQFGLRLDQLTEWVAQQLKLQGYENADPLELEVVSGDASFRRYFRARVSNGSLIAVDAPPPQEDCRPFVSVAESLLAAGVAVPKVIAVDFELGFMLLSDLGDDVFLDGLSSPSVDLLYEQALKCLPGIMSCTGDVPVYDRAKLLQEMSLFSDWFIKQYLSIDFNTELLTGVFDWLAESALSQPQVFVHRDYHSRNLMITSSSDLSTDLGIIDFQDAVVGPITYDIVSLLRDCYVAWPLSRVERWADGVRVQLQRKNLLSDSVDQRQFMTWFDLMGAQRHLKAIGIFSRLNCRDSKSAYLLDIPRTLRYLLDVCDVYDELNELAREIRRVVLPALFDKNKEAIKWFQEDHYIDIDMSTVAL